MLGQLTDSSSSDESSHKSPTFSNDANTNDISSILEKIDDQSQRAICNDKFHIVTKVTERCEFSPNYFLHGEVTSFDIGTWIYTVHFDWEDNADPQHYTEDELQKIISKPVVGIGGIAFVPHTEMLVFVYKGEIEVKAEIVHVFKHDAKLKWANDSLLSTFCVPYIKSGP